MVAELVSITRIKKSELHSAVSKWDGERKKGLLPPQLPLDRLSLKLAESRTVNGDPPIPDCITCGVCCVFAVLVPVSFDESKHIDPTIDVLLDDADEDIVIDRFLPRGEDGRCENLLGQLGESIGCSIYEDRPSVCRNFDAGSDRCREYRRMFGIEEQLSEEELAEALSRINKAEDRRLIEDVCIVKTGTVERMSFSASEGRATQTNEALLTIVAFLNDDTEHELHTFENGKEVWFESDLLGISLEEARVKIEEQAGW